MADISNYISQIVKEDSTGASVRFPIIDALNAINEKGVTSAGSLGNKTKDAYVLKSEFDELMNFDNRPAEGSSQAISSSGTYEFQYVFIDTLMSLLFPEAT